MNKLDEFALSYFDGEVYSDKIESFPVENLSQEVLLKILLKMIDKLLDCPKLINRMANVPLGEYTKTFDESIYVLLEEKYRILGISSDKIFIFDKNLFYFYKNEVYEKFEKKLNESFSDQDIKACLIKVFSKLKEDIKKNESLDVEKKLKAGRSMASIKKFFRKLKF